jgi:hypothetical protein
MEGTPLEVDLTSLPEDVILTVFQVEKIMYQLMDYFTTHGHKTVMVGPKGRKLMPILLMESNGLTVKMVPLTEERFLRELPLPPRSRGITSVAKRFKAFGNRTGSTKAAKSFLKQVMVA